ncbi:large conductance mechanosensitive channel protein MscL [Chitinophaga caeni]|uniref:Large-conductance mechanosensitive channel n=1 Tax=Chitinophaga caeni TaxID=2029983 RepID=A0A291QSR8_9BACT|nr:large-conductance mechanosensitive channel protein MscL [Chitinophaga caeni]ATL46922.1 large conductance mechanosensitive channel protein MscL [Chitinophaga caeni]
MSFIKEFKEFAMKGNVIDMAVGIVIGAAFGKIVSALVNNIIMPLVGILIGGLDFKNLKITVGNAEVGYGIFIQTIVEFIIVAFAIFLLIKAINRMKRKKEEAPAPPPGPTNEEKLLMEIRDALKSK